MRYELIKINSSTKTINKRQDPTTICMVENLETIKTSNKILDLLKFLNLELVEDDISYDMNCAMAPDCDIHFETDDIENYILLDNETGLYYRINNKYPEDLGEPDNYEDIYVGKELSWEERCDELRKNSQNVTFEDFEFTIIGNKESLDKELQIRKWVM